MFDGLALRKPSQPIFFIFHRFSYVYAHFYPDPMTISKSTLRMIVTCRHKPNYGAICLHSRICQCLVCHRSQPTSSPNLIRTILRSISLRQPGNIQWWELFGGNENCKNILQCKTDAQAWKCLPYMLISRYVYHVRNNKCRPWAGIHGTMAIWRASISVLWMPHRLNRGARPSTWTSRLQCPSPTKPIYSNGSVAVSFYSGSMVALPVAAIESNGMAYAESGVTKISTRCGNSSYQWAFESVACRNLERKRRAHAQ